MYELLSKCYDRFVGVDYDDLAAMISSVLTAYGVSGKALDIACGTGELTARLKLSGLDMTGVDLSEDMLCLAGKKYPGIGFLKQDMTELSFENEFEAAVCTLDALNHLSSEDMLKKAFMSVARALKKGGVFIFDMNSPYKHKEILANNTFDYDEDDLSLVWKNECYDDLTVKISLELTDKKTGEIFKESFLEHVWELSTVRGLLESCGFVTDEVYSGFYMDEIDDECERYFFITRRI